MNLNRKDAFLSLLKMFRAALEENGEVDIAMQIPFVGEVSEYRGEAFDCRLIQLFSLVAHILNMVEVKLSVDDRRDRETPDMRNVQGLFAENIKYLLQMGINEDDIIEALPVQRIEPVLTAHPTEAKRATVLEHHREIFLDFKMLLESNLSSTDRSDLEARLRRKLYTLWRTGEIFIEKPDVPSERRNILYYFTEVFPEVLPVLDRRLKHAFSANGLDVDKLIRKQGFPKYRFGNWVGGDRDGHPLVTTEITHDTLMDLRLHAFVVLRRKLLYLVKTLSFRIDLDAAPEVLRRRISDMVANEGGDSKAILARNRGEAFRQYLGLILDKLPLNTERGHSTTLRDRPGDYRFCEELISDLQILQEAMLEYGARTIANEEIHDVIRLVETFGFHLAELDIRQNSMFHDKAISQLLEAVGMAGMDYLNADFAKRRDLMQRELRTLRPFAGLKQKLPTEATLVTEVYAMIDEFTRKFGIRPLGSLIVSMTRDVSDLLAVYLLAREAGLLVKEDEGIVCKMPVVPLFETIADLIAAPAILDEFLTHPITLSTIRYQQRLRGERHPVQTVMVGYSDSNKDGGIVASQWLVHRSQQEMAEVGDRHAITIRFFHGKGGSISRGGGPTKDFLRALPPNALRGDIRLTEQGESIEQKYANRVNAVYNLELLLAGTLGKTLASTRATHVVHPLFEALEWMSQVSQNTYQDLIASENFMEFYRHATPIDAIESGRIGSRPSRRTGATSISDLRAIPWVFSWSQSRFAMTSWYGLGNTLDRMKKERPDWYQAIRRAAHDDPFVSYLMRIVASGISFSDAEIMRQYAGLVKIDEVRQRIFSKFEIERDRTIHHLAEIFEVDVDDQLFQMDKRRQNLLAPLHGKQMDLLCRWREQGIHGKADEELLLSLLLTINAISGVMGYTG